ncbi:MAG TPA: hypothetical protein VGT24_12515, partial [Candidatus Acidoferrales bacterium]|nr:hypothetical protein [Candidatus Acidoferrales bacterium]
MRIFAKVSSRYGAHSSVTFWQIGGLVLAAVVLIVLASLRIFVVPLVHVLTQPVTVTASSPFSVWVVSSMVRVRQMDAPGNTSSITLSGARGETVDAQLIVQAPAGNLTNVNLSASALVGPGGASIPASSVTLYREYYITVNGTASYGGGSNPPLGSGTYPEPLIPFNDPETNQPLCGTAAVLKACNASVSADQNQ